MYVLLEFWQKIMAIPIMNPLSCFMIWYGSTHIQFCLLKAGIVSIKSKVACVFYLFYDTL